MVGCPFYRELLPLGRRMLGGGVGKRLCQSLSPWLCLLLPKVLMSWGVGDDRLADDKTGRTCQSAIPLGVLVENL